MKIKIFILAYNEKTFEKAKKRYEKYEWAHPIFLQNATKNNPYFENIIYLNLEENLTKNSISIKEFDFLGTLSYKAYKKINLNEINKYIMKFGTKYDFIHFFSIRNKTVEKSNLNGGDNFKTLWNDCCKNTIGCLETTGVGFCNYWMAKKEYFINYCNFLKEFVQSLDCHPNILMNGHYAGGTLKKKQLIQLCGKPYYPILPFILERSVVGYFEQQKFEKFRQKNNILCMNKVVIAEVYEEFQNISTDIFISENLSEKKNTVLFLLYNDENISEFEKISEVIPIKLNQNHYFESEFFRMFEEKNFSQIQDIDNIGIITPSFYKKIQKSIPELLLLNPNPIKKLFLLKTKMNYYDHGIYTHGKNFKIIWDWLVLKLNINFKKIKKNKKSVGFYSNLWIAKKSFFLKYIEFAKKSMELLDNAPENIKKLLHSNSNYPGNLLKEGKLIEKFGYNWYPMHPFIMERLICLFSDIYSDIH
jgi:hypothetical protein